MINRTFILALIAFLSLGVAAATAAETAQEQSTEKPAAAKAEAAKAEAAKTEGAKTEAAKPTEENSVLLNVPLFSSIARDVPIASVDDELISLQELNESFFSLHESSKEDKATKLDYKPILDRLINVTLIDMEAREMELDKLPEVKDALQKNEESTLREMLKARQTKDLEPDPKLVDKFYKDATREYKIISVIFTKEENAKKMAADLKSGKDFEGLAKKAIEDKTAKGSVEGQFIKADQLLPQVAAEIGKLKTGGATPVIRVQDGYTVMKLEGVRYTEDEKARKDAEEKALGEKKNEALKKYYEGLKKKYVTVNSKLLKGLDFEKSVDEFAKMFKDKRSVAKIKGDKPITVGELTEAINAKFFHGIEAAIRDKKVNSIKATVLDEMIYKRLTRREAKALGIDQTDEYKNALERYERSVLFVAFIQTAIVPDIKVSEDDSKKYYEEHIADYTTPMMMKLFSLAFYKVKDAEDTLKKLQQGDDFKWLQSNASGQLKEDATGALSLNGDVFTLNGLDEGLRKALTGVKTGDYRLYSDGKYYYVIYVKEDIQPKKQDYKDARESTAKKVFNEKVNQAVQDWAGKLRKAHKVKVYITGISTTAE